MFGLYKIKRQFYFKKICDIIFLNKVKKYYESKK